SGGPSTGSLSRRQPTWVRRVVEPSLAEALAGAVVEEDAVLRKTCATYYDEHVPESSVEILGHSVGGITYRHYAHRALLAFKAIMTLPQPSGFSAILRAGDSECPCCRRRFADAG